MYPPFFCPCPIFQPKQSLAAVIPRAGRMSLPCLGSTPVLTVWALNPLWLSTRVGLGPAPYLKRCQNEASSRRASWQGSATGTCCCSDPKAGKPSDLTGLGLGGCFQSRSHALESFTGTLPKSSCFKAFFRPSGLASALCPPTLVKGVSVMACKGSWTQDRPCCHGFQAITFLIGT